MAEAADAAFSKFAKMFHKNVPLRVSGRYASASYISQLLTTSLESIFKDCLGALLYQNEGGVSWDKGNEKLDLFLSSLSNIDSSRFPLNWTIEPTDSDKQSLICKQCHKPLDYSGSIGMYMEDWIIDMSPERGRWHPDCLPCRLCKKSISNPGKPHVKNLASFKCEKESCGFISEFLFIPSYYQIVCGMWLSWSVVVYIQGGDISKSTQEISQER